jgi:soluble lytic murein transglycosylase-like protein
MRLLLLISFIIIGIFSGPACADIYKYVDTEGVIHLTNVPTDNGVKYVLIMREKRILLDKKLGEHISTYDNLIIKASEKHNVEPALIKAIIKAESNFNHRAVSRKGARGLMQLMPATASSLQVQDSFHPENNIEGGVRYLRYLLNYFNGNLPFALAAYNAGENAVIRHRGIPPYRETQMYVQRVLSYLDKFR